MIGRNVTLRSVTGGGYDVYGDPLPETITDTVLRAMVAPRESEEPVHQNRAGIIVGLVAYLPPSAPDVTHVDRVLVEGIEYEIEGEPGKWFNPSTGALNGVQVALRRAAG